MKAVQWLRNVRSYELPSCSTPPAYTENPDRCARSSSRASRCRIFMEKQKTVEITVRKGVENLPKGHDVGMDFFKKNIPR